MNESNFLCKSFCLRAKKLFERYARVGPGGFVFVSAACLFVIFIWYHYLSMYWGRWGSVNVDFGREVYIPWQMLQGKVLYKDIANINCPISPLLNAMFFGIFGASINTIEIVNLIISAVVAFFVWIIVLALADGLTAIVSVIVFFDFCF